MEAAQIRSFVDETYRRAFGARYAAGFGEYLSTVAKGRAALGYRRAGSGPLYLEAYLDAPIETLLAAALRRPVPRESIVEIGNLAADNAWAMIALWGEAANDLGDTSEVVVATLTAPLRRIFGRIGVPLQLLMRAEPERLGNDAADWGSYYALDPVVCAGSIVEGQRAIGKFLTRHRGESAA